MPTGLTDLRSLTSHRQKLKSEERNRKSTEMLDRPFWKEWRRTEVDRTQGWRLGLRPLIMWVVPWSAQAGRATSAG